MTDAASPVPASPPHPRDAVWLAAARGVQGVYVNPSRWWQNASFALPALIAVASLIGGQLFGSAEATGFGLFAVVVTLIMIPVVLLTWRGTATAIVLTDAGATALHEGRVLHDLAWSELRRIERVEYLGNTRFKLVHGDEDRFMVVESEIERGAALVDQAFALSGIPRQSEAATG
ncbi:MAG: hypothetical protein CVU47_04215 [Chloroflexi bacterium HGW-Chloroflexi-9]|nr:MAG: hypothetical protein CVU47_04215 [Chloroflexi bacterium HGW-Chloroflexi-9]